MNISAVKVDFQGLPIRARLCNIRHMNPHFHDEALEFAYCLEGRVTLYNSFQTFVLEAGMMCSIDSHDIHCYEASEDNLVLICHVDLTCQKEDFDYLNHVYFACETENLFPYQKESMEWLEKAFLSVALIQAASAEADGDSYSRLTGHLIDIMLKHFNYYTYLTYEGYMNDALYNRFQQILIYCHKHYKEKVTIAQLASMVNINANYFSQFLRKTNFGTFSNMLKYVRAYETEHLFLTTDISITEASYRCGFSDPKYFFAAFKERWHRTPNQHRQWYQKFAALPDQITVLSGPEAKPLIEKHMTQWMVKKTLYDL